MKTIVIYKSNSGFVKKYADIISSELKCDVAEVSSTNISEILKYDVIIFGGGLYAVGINGISLIKKNIDKLKDKKVVVFASGASPYRKEVCDEVIDKNFEKANQKNIKFFYLRGGFDFDKLKFKHKLVMKLMKKQLEKKDNPTEDEIGMLKAFDVPVDFTSKDNAEDLINYVRSLNNKIDR
jgi:menaquinone-dependent protoporphyrinogen IX oxidase